MQAASETVLVDLHTHTDCSDGTWSASRLLAEIRARKLDFFCIADHDGIDAYPVPDDLRERCIPGLEVDSHLTGQTAHLLAYGIHDRGSPLLRRLTEQRQGRLQRMERLVEAVRAQGIAVSMDDVRFQAGTSPSLGRPHLARALVHLGVVDTMQEAFDRYLADDACAYVPLERLPSETAIELIHASGGVAVVAHPERLRGADALEQLLEAGVDGIEVIHPSADETAQRRLRRMTHERDLLATGGTDFHSPVPGRELGVPLPREDVERLLAAITASAASVRQ